MDANTLNCYRANYNLEHWESARYHGFPMDAACLAIAELCNEVERLSPVETNLRQQIAHLNDEIAGLRSDKAMLQKKRVDLLMALDDAATSLETIELRSYGESSCLDSKIQMRGYAGSRSRVARKAIADDKCYGQAEKQAKTEVPAIVFYPAGSLGEEVEEVAKALMPLHLSKG